MFTRTRIQETHPQKNPLDQSGAKTIAPNRNRIELVFGAHFGAFIKLGFVCIRHTHTDTHARTAADRDK